MKKAHVVAVDMGYGHERAASALRALGGGDVLIANKYHGIPDRDRALWEQSRKFYETVSRLQPLPVVGSAIFKAFVDISQKIEPFYPRRDLARPTLQTRQTYFAIRHGLGRDLVERLRAHPLPFISTFFLPAFAAEEYDYPGDIYIALCDADISRAWAPYDPKHSRIKYFAPNGRVRERLKLYGVNEENIYLTGFPLPPELIDGPQAPAARRDLHQRICNLDPQGIFWRHYERLLRTELGSSCTRVRRNRPVSVTFSVGGAGAQKLIAITALRSLRAAIRRRQVRVHLVAGTRRDVAGYFTREVRRLGLGSELGKGVTVFFRESRHDYFADFPRLLSHSDVLWTKPSELVFYTGLGLPILMAPPIGSQEEFNRKWLFAVGGGTDQLDPEHMEEWLFDWLESGALARMAWNGFIEAPTHGTYRITQIITGRPYKLETLPLIV